MMTLLAEIVSRISGKVTDSTPGPRGYNNNYGLQGFKRKNVETLVSNVRTSVSGATLKEPGFFRGSALKITGYTVS